MGNRVFTQTEYSGSVASFTGTEGSSITSLIANIAPIQDLHGYASPWPGGGGKNKAKVVYKNISSATGYSNLQDNSVTVYSSSTTAVYRCAQFALLDAEGYAGQTLTFTAKAQQVTGSSTPRILGRLYDSNGSSVGSKIFEKTGTSITHTFTLPATIDSGVTFRVSLYCNSGYAEATETNFYDIQVEVGSTPHDFAPYENICPITGRTVVSVTRTGKNLLRVSPVTQTVNGITFTVNDDGTISLSGTATQNTNYFISMGERSFPNGSFVLSGCPSGGGVSTYYLRIDNATGGPIAADYGGGRQFTIADGKIYTVFINVKSGVNTNGLVFKPMVELGSTATTYEPFGNTIAVDWTSEAGTVYGGTLDVVTGVLTVTHVMKDLGSLSWTKYASYHTFVASISDMYPVDSTDYARGLICSAYPSVNYWWSSSSKPDFSISHAGTNTIAIKDSSKDSLTVGDFKTAMSGIQLVYELATPLTYQLTPQEVAVLVGQNNVWSNAGGSVDVIVSSPLQGFHGWLIKVKQGNNLVEIPLTFIRAETYTVTPDQRLEWSAERDVTGVLHRETTENTPPKIEFETPLMTNTDIHALNTIIQNGFTNTLGRDVTIQFYNPEKNEYWQWDCYMPDVHYNIRNVDTAHNVINYEQLRYAFIGY